MYHVYILASRRHGTLYIGATNSLQERLEQHRNGKGYSFVKAHGVFRLAYVESYDRVEEAITREKQLKRWKRGWKIELTERENLFARVGSFSKTYAGGYGSLLFAGTTLD
jgi:putative endonuclease